MSPSLFLSFFTFISLRDTCFFIFIFIFFVAVFLQINCNNYSFVEGVWLFEVLMLEALALSHLLTPAALTLRDTC
jgi:hypothetical protein